MFYTKRSSFNSTKEINEIRVIRLVREKEPISRSEISKITKISKATVSDITSRFIEGGVLTEIGKGKSTYKGGKKPTLLKIEPFSGAIIGIEIKRTFSNVAISDLKGNLFKCYRIDYQVGESSENVLKEIFKKVNLLLKLKEFKNAKKWAISIGLPGIIDYKNGILKVADTLQGWDNLEIRKIFEDKYKIPTYIENDIKALTIGECLYGAGQGYKDIICLCFGDGIGAGIVINNNLLRGVTGSVGEIGYNELGYLLTSKKLLPLLYDNQRDFGDIISEHNIVTAAEKALYNGYSSKLADHLPITMEKILLMAQNGDELAYRIIKEFSILIGVVCINLVNTVNPELIILNGNIVRNGNILVDLIKYNVQKDILRTPAEAVKIKVGALGDNGILTGVVSIVLNDWFALPLCENFPLR